MYQPKRFQQKENINCVSLSNKYLYGLKQALKQWYKMFDTFIMGLDFATSEYDSCFCFKRKIWL